MLAWPFSGKLQYDERLEQADERLATNGRNRLTNGYANFRVPICGTSRRNSWNF